MPTKDDMKTTATATVEPVKTSDGKPLRIAILGATGSIGCQTIDLVVRHPERFEVIGLSANTRVDEAVEACRRVHPRYLVMCDPRSAEVARHRLSIDVPEVKVLGGSDSMVTLATLPEVDMVVTATVGYSGLLPTLAAIGAGKDIALANKETLVVAGDYIQKHLAESKSKIFPIDSEHSAIAQCLRGEAPSTVKRLIITASGGPFRTWPVERLADATVADALRHPNWSMGAKITVDSATMMNKAFEIIEAHYLFGLPAGRITALVHPQSIVHSMVEFTDGAIKAQLGVPDMHLPIAYALGMNHRISEASAPLSLADMSTLTFELPDLTKFPCLDFARIALGKRGNTACVINAANEIAVDSFLLGRIRFTDFVDVIEYALSHTQFISEPSPEDFIETNKTARIRASERVEKLNELKTNLI